MFPVKTQNFAVFLHSSEQYFHNFLDTAEIFILKIMIFMTLSFVYVASFRIEKKELFAALYSMFSHNFNIHRTTDNTHSTLSLTLWALTRLFAINFIKHINLFIFQAPKTSFACQLIMHSMTASSYDFMMHKNIHSWI